MNPPADTSPESVIDAGNFGLWLSQARAALRGDGGMDVPCGDCVGCCTSGYSILLRPQDQAIDIVPAKFLSSVNGLAYPHSKMNPLANGHCPMFNEGKCSIYASRPQTCLDYDCRVFAAAGIDAGDRPIINKRINEWRFEYATEEEIKAHAAVQQAAKFITRHAERFPNSWKTATSSAIAVLAVKVYELFLDQDADNIDIALMTNNIVDAVRCFDSSISEATHNSD